MRDGRKKGNKSQEAHSLKIENRIGPSQLFNMFNDMT